MTQFPKTEKGRLVIAVSLFLSIVALTILTLTTGCTINLLGDGELALGMRNTNEVFVRHDAGDDRESDASIILTEDLWSLIKRVVEKTEEDQNVETSTYLGDGPNSAWAFDGVSDPQ